jgi:Flp pilus assembly protein TadG
MRFSRRFSSRDGGMATAELAACLPVLMILVLAGLAAVSVADQRIRVHDAATAIARAQARGDPATAQRLFTQLAPSGSTFTVRTGDGEITATVHVTVRPFGHRFGSYDLTEQSVAAIEPGAPVQ